MTSMILNKQPNSRVNPLKDPQQQRNRTKSDLRASRCAIFLLEMEEGSRLSDKLRDQRCNRASLRSYLIFTRHRNHQSRFQFFFSKWRKRHDFRANCAINDVIERASGATLFSHVIGIINRDFNQRGVIDRAAIKLLNDNFKV